MRKDTAPLHEHHSSANLIPGTHCANCQAPLQGKWCSQCGQQWAALNPTWHDFVSEATQEFLPVDNKIFRTVRLLFFHPGELTAEFLRGRRVRYISALRLYLTMSLLFFFLSSVLPNPNVIPGSDHPKPAHAKAKQKGTGGVLTTIETGSEVADHNSAHFEEALSQTFPKILFVLVPLFAVLLRVTYRNRHRNYPQFLYFSLHIHAAFFGFLLLTLPLQTFASDNWISLGQLIVLLASFVYLIYALKRVFGGRTWQTFLRAFAVTSAYLVVFAAATVFVVMALLYRLGQAGG